MPSIGYKLRTTNGDTFYIKADGDIDAVAMWVTKNSNGHGFTVDDSGTYIRIRDIVSIEQCDEQKVPENCSTCIHWEDDEDSNDFSWCWEKEHPTFGIEECDCYKQRFFLKYLKNKK